MFRASIVRIAPDLREYVLFEAVPIWSEKGSGGWTHSPGGIVTRTLPRTPDPPQDWQPSGYPTGAGTYDGGMGMAMSAGYGEDAGDFPTVARSHGVAPSQTEELGEMTRLAMDAAEFLWELIAIANGNLSNLDDEMRGSAFELVSQVIPPQQPVPEASLTRRAAHLTPAPHCVYPAPPPAVQHAREADPRARVGLLGNGRRR